MARPKYDIYEQVTEEIIAAMEAGAPPWRKPWTGETGSVSFPLRSSGETYRGINVLILWLTASAKGYSSARWFTYRQAKLMGAQVRKGEKSATVVKYGTFERENQNGEEETIPYAKAYSVFNADQISGLPQPYYRKPEPPRDLGTNADPELDVWFAGTGLNIRTSEQPRAYYNRKDDYIHLPPISTFHTAHSYYHTLAHEACHATGHQSRLDRFQTFSRKQDYAREELIAEIGGAMVCAGLGVVPEFEQNAAYVKSWLKALKDDKREIFRAAAAAQKAVDWLYEKADRKKQAA